MFQANKKDINIRNKIQLSKQIRNREEEIWRDNKKKIRYLL